MNDGISFSTHAQIIIDRVQTLQTALIKWTIIIFGIDADTRTFEEKNEGNFSTTKISIWNGLSSNYA